MSKKSEENWTCLFLRIEEKNLFIQKKVNLSKDGSIICQVKKCGFLTLPFYYSDDQRKDYKITSNGMKIHITYIREERNDKFVSWARKEGFDGRIVLRKKILSDLEICEGDYLKLSLSDNRDEFVLEKYNDIQ